jgi:hypothetical protein
MTKERKTTTPNQNDPNDTLIRGPIVQGKIAGARMIGEAIIKKGKGYSDTAPFSDEYFEYVAAAIRLTHFLKGFYDAIEEVLGGGYGKGLFDRVIAAGTGDKSDQKLRDQVRLLRRYFAEPKPNASKVAREAAGSDVLVASKLTALNRLRKSHRLTTLARIDLALGLDTAKIQEGRPPTVKEILQHLHNTGKSLD